ncbi:sensor domain-containing diguanylate cyclase [Motiliproteus coralliicola]|uniref:Sensor domain-containing diguanylate cyclase n=1 Tax=Motiliproteus coralliicola TaxID=2283196 RepID=A0A369WZA6_9GAMM|nr:diguanylate cyclase [Motiliproteus coralliicola]RDE24845.1 sensor domain-containing diguanylate cyclase [Motiliproteus coralliicola]
MESPSNPYLSATNLYAEALASSDLFSNNKTIMLLICPTTGSIVGASSGACEYYGYSREQLTSMAIAEINTASVEEISKEMNRAESESRNFFVFSHRLSSGEIRNVEVISTPISVGENKLLFSVINDVTEKLIAEEKAKRTLSELETILDNAHEGIAYIRNRVFVRVNNWLLEQTGYLRTELEGSDTSIIHESLKSYHQIGKEAYSGIEGGNVYRAEIRLKRKDESLFWCRITGREIDQNAEGAGSIWLFDDISKQRQKEQALHQRANFDHLTGLPNRALFLDRLTQAISRAKRNGERLALLFADLNGFKAINDSLGHSAGDQALIEIAERLTQTIRASDTLARFAGDEFTMVLPGIDSQASIDRFIGKINQQFDQPFVIDGIPIALSLSIGAAIYPEQGESINELLVRADEQMYQQKRASRKPTKNLTQSIVAVSQYFSGPNENPVQKKPDS